MSLEDFQLLDNEPFDNSIVKRDYLKIHHQKGAQLNDADQNIEFIFGKNNNYHQIGNSYFEFDISIRDPTAGFIAKAEIRLVNNAFAYCFKEGLIATTGGLDIEHVKFFGQISTIMRSLTIQNGELLSHFHKINDGDTNASINNTSLKQMFFDTFSVSRNRRRNKGQLPLEHIFGFCKTF